MTNFRHNLSLALDDRVDYVEVRLQSENNDHNDIDVKRGKRLILYVNMESLASIYS